MKIGLLTDVHEDVERLARALQRLKALGAERFLFLGDLFEVGDPERLDAVAGLLEDAGAVGVWGNHDYGLCVGPDEQALSRYSERSIRVMGGFRPRIEVEGCYLSHIEPWLDPESLEDLWWFEGYPETPERVNQSFAAVPHRLIFMGHNHRWHAAVPGQILDWQGEGPLAFDPAERYLVVVHAVTDGWAALLDTSANVLTPVPLDTPGPGLPE